MFNINWSFSWTSCASGVIIAPLCISSSDFRCFAASVLVLFVIIHFLLSWQLAPLVVLLIVDFVAHCQTLAMWSSLLRVTGSLGHCSWNWCLSGSSSQLSSTHTTDPSQCVLKICLAFHVNFLNFSFLNFITAHLSPYLVWYQLCSYHISF